MTRIAATDAACAACTACAARRRWPRRLGRFVGRTLALVGLLYLVLAPNVTWARMVSDSMAPTLDGDATSGDWVLIERMSYRLRSPRRWECLSYFGEEGALITKRVVGLPGEELALDDAGRPIDRRGGAPIPAPEETTVAAIRYLPAGKLSRDATLPVGPAEVAVLGDNTRVSFDSRFRGAIPLAEVEGRAVAIFWPPSRMRWLP